MNGSTNLYELLKKAFKKTDDNFEEMVSTLTEDELYHHFFLSDWPINFTAWGEKYVYFPVVWECDSWVGYAPRNPCNEKTQCQGNG